MATIGGGVGSKGVNTIYRTLAYSATLTYTHDPNNPNAQVVLSGNMTIALTSGNEDMGLLRIQKTTGSEVVTFPGVLKGSLAVTASAVDMISWINDNGTIRWFVEGASALSLTTTGSSGPATLSGGILNVPNYAGGTFSSLTTTGSSGAATLVAGVLNVPNYSVSATMSIGSAVTSGTTGSILFVQGGNLAQDNATLFWDDTNNRLGLLTPVPTHSLTFASTSTGVAFYNTTDQVTNYERSTIAWAANDFVISTTRGGTGAIRNIILGSGSAAFIRVNNASSRLEFSCGSGITGTNIGFLYGSGNIFTASNTVPSLMGLFSTVTETLTGGYRMLWVSPFENTVGSGSKLLIDLGTNTAAGGGGTHTSKFSIDSSGNVISTGAQTLNIVTTAASTYTILPTDNTVIGTGTTSTWTFPTATTGRILRLTNHGTGSIVLGTAVTTANGVTSTTLVAGASYIIQYDGSVWRKIN